MLRITFIFLFLLTATALHGAPNFEVGISTGKHTPINLVAGIQFHSFVTRIEGMGYGNSENDFWLSTRGTFAYRFFSDLPFSIETGFSCGHLYAKAPNKRNIAFNKANQTNYLWDYNYKEYLDLSLAFSARLFGFQTSVFLPVYKPINSSSTRWLWNVSYIIEL